jgi:hypothetical protein
VGRKGAPVTAATWASPGDFPPSLKKAVQLTVLSPRLPQKLPSTRRD